MALHPPICKSKVEWLEIYPPNSSLFKEIMKKKLCVILQILPNSFCWCIRVNMDSCSMEMTFLPKTVPFAMRVFLDRWNTRRTQHEEAFFRRTDHRYPEGDRSGRKGQGSGAPHGADYPILRQAIVILAEVDRLRYQNQCQSMIEFFWKWASSWSQHRWFTQQIDLYWFNLWRGAPDLW